MNTEILALSRAITQAILEKTLIANQQFRNIENSAYGEVAALRARKAALVSEKGHCVANKKSLKIVGLFYNGLAIELSEYFELNGHQAKIFEDIDQLKAETEPYDIFFTTSNYILTSERLSAVVEYTVAYGQTGLSCIWLWDHHHMIGGSLSMAAYFDVVFPIHETSADYLKVINPHVMNSLPAATYQFGSFHETERMYRAVGASPRLDALYGGFREYPNMARNAILRECIEKIPGNVLCLRSQNATDDSYYNLPTPQDRFAQWAKHKVSLSVSINTDIPIRIFDALAAGQIPLVCSNINGFDRVVSVEDQMALPVVRFSHYDFHEIRRAYEIALERFDQGGMDGAFKRHAYAMRHHMMINRVIQMVAVLRLHFR